MKTCRIIFYAFCILSGMSCIGQAPPGPGTPLIKPLGLSPAQARALEIPPAHVVACFAGAYYRKAVTSFDVWTGITGTVILGNTTVDESRLDTKTQLPLDNFSVYMGGNAGGKHEVDAGLTWEFSSDPVTGVLSKRRNSWRPFWRTNIYRNAPNKPEFVWHSGDTVQMTVVLISTEKLQLIVQDLNNLNKRFQVDFKASGFTADVPRQFKRVNAIDQSHNEGKPVQPTTAQVTGAEWLNTMLYRGTRVHLLPMNKLRFTDMRCNDPSHIVVSTTNEATGAEKIDIFGSPVRYTCNQSSLVSVFFNKR